LKEKKEWVDFKAVKAAVTMKMLLEHYGVSGLKREGDELRGRCPIHPSSAGAGVSPFSVNLDKNAFKCFASNCGVHGNVLDFVAAKEKCSVKEAALKMHDWFKVGDSDASGSGRENQSSLNHDAVELLSKLVAEVEVHNSQIANHTSSIREKTAAIKEIVATLQTEV